MYTRPQPGAVHDTAHHDAHRNSNTMQQVQTLNVNANVRKQIDTSARAAVDDDAGGSFPSRLVPAAAAAAAAAAVTVAVVVVVASGHAALLLISAVLLVVPSGAIVPFPGVRRSVAVSAPASARVPLPRSCHRSDG